MRSYLAPNSSPKCTKGIQILLCIIAGAALLVLLNSNASIPVNVARTLQNNKHEASAISAPLLSVEDIVDYKRCSPIESLSIFVHSFDHPLAVALASHPTAVTNQKQACLFISFTDGNHSLPRTWNAVSAPGLNHVIINLNNDVSISARGREMIVQANFERGAFRPLLDFSLFTDVPEFKSETWKDRPSIMPLKRANKFTIFVDFLEEPLSGRIPQVECAGNCAPSLISSTFCLLPPSLTFNLRLLDSLRAGCIPVVLSLSQPLPFQDQLEWKLASFRFPMSMLDLVPEKLEKPEKEDLLEMRRRGRVFLARIDDALALSKSLVAALAGRILIDLPQRSPVPSNLIAPNNIFANKSCTFTRIHSKFGSQTLSASGLYSSARWNSGRDLTYTPTTLHDVPQMPGDAPFYEGTKENIVSVNGNPRLGLTRDEEQFTAIILTYDRDDGVKTIIKKLKDCPHLNKIIIVWNNQERRPNGTWPEIHVPVEFILAERNSLLSRFLPYDRIETEAIVSLDDDIGLDQSELTFAFRMWRENRDRLVGFPERYHKFQGGNGKYGLSGTCEHSLILTGYTFLHKEFLFEFSFNQHPAILEYIEKNRNCEDLAMNYLVAHLTRRPPLKVIKKVNINNGSAKSGLSSRGNHYKERDHCIDMLSRLYGYNPLLFSQETARPNGNCVKGL